MIASHFIRRPLVDRIAGSLLQASNGQKVSSKFKLAEAQALIHSKISDVRRQLNITQLQIVPLLQPVRTRD